MDLFGDSPAEAPGKSLFADTPKSGDSPAGGLFGGSDSDGALSFGGDSAGALFGGGDGASTFRKMDSSFGAGASEERINSPDMEYPSSPVATVAVPPEEAIRKMEALVSSGAASSEALSLLRGALEGQMQQAREQNREVATQIASCTDGMQRHLDLAQMFEGESSTPELQAANEALKQLQEIQSQLILS